MNIPNLLTLLRILLIPFMVLFYALPVTWGHTVAALIFALAGITDWLDGYLARNLKQGTRFGAFLDPVADKLIVAVALVLIVGYVHALFLSIPAAVIVAREIMISGLREWMAEMGQRKKVSVGIVAKIKTGCQMVALCILLFYQFSGALWIKEVGSILLYLAAFLTLWSMIVYLKAAWPELMSSSRGA